MICISVAKELMVRPAEDRKPPTTIVHAQPKRPIRMLARGPEKSKRSRSMIEMVETVEKVEMVEMVEKVEMVER